MFGIVPQGGVRFAAMATLTRRKPLAVVPGVVCPAAVPIAGAVAANAGVICRVMQMDRDREHRAGLTPAQLALARDGSDGVLLTAKSDPSTIERMCCADGDVPVLDHFEKHGGRESYTYCPVWQAEKERIAEGREMLAELRVPESVSHFDDGRGFGAETRDTSDPWAQARRDLDELAPPRVGGV